jgi:hypothetical protein
MNIMFLIRSKENKNEIQLITAPLTRGDILPGKFKFLFAAAL